MKDEDNIRVFLDLEVEDFEWKKAQKIGKCKVLGKRKSPYFTAFHRTGPKTKCHECMGVFSLTLSSQDIFFQGYSLHPQTSTNTFYQNVS